MKALRIEPSRLAQLERRAREAAEHSYSPYSRFKVGAAVMTEDGSIFSGCNVENASFGLTLCAERNAIGQAVAAGQRQIVAMAIYTPTNEPTAPCGACRQVIREFGPGARVICICDSVQRLTATLDRLLPEGFGGHFPLGERERDDEPQ